jgi:hypothetical protein
VTDTDIDIRGSAPIMTTKDVILEMRSDIKSLGADVADIKREQSLVADHLTRDKDLTIERRNRMMEIQTGFSQRLDDHETQIDSFHKWKNEASGALALVRWALGASLLAAVLVVIEIGLAVTGHKP